MESTGRDPEETEATVESAEVDDVTAEGLGDDSEAADGLAAAASGEITDERADVSAAASSAAAAVDPADDAAPADPADATADIDPADDSDVVLPVRPRSAPRYGAFIGAGVVAGIILALILFFVLPSDGSSSSLTGLFYLALLVTPFTAVLGGLAAVLFERRSLRK